MQINEIALQYYLKSKNLDMDIFNGIKALSTNPSISAICLATRNGCARDHYEVHDILMLSGYEMEIIGFNHDKVANNPERPTITLMSKSLLPARRMHSRASENGWVNTEMRKWLNEEFIKTLPDELVDHIPGVTKITHNSEGKAFKTVDRLFLPSESELFGSAIWAAREEGARYEAFSDSNDRIRYDEDGDNCRYWSRSSVCGGNSANCAAVGYTGIALYTSASNTSIRAPLCFCLA